MVSSSSNASVLGVRGRGDAGGRCVLTAPGRVSFEPQGPLSPRSTEARIRITRAGICGTDLSIWRGDYRVALPLVLGHEWVGIVEAVGSAVRSVEIGARVVGEINFPCRSRHEEDPCPACRAGLETHCLSRSVMGIDRADGCFASRVCVPADNLHVVPPSVTDEQAVLVEPLAAAIQTFELSPLYPGDRVVVLGAGRLGALILQVARLRGARVIVVTRSQEKRRRAKKLGAHEVLAPGTDLSRRIRDMCGGLGADMVVEATGSVDGLPLALELVRPRGVIALKTTCGQSSSFDVTSAVVREIQISTSRCGPFGKAIAMLREGKVKVGPLITAEFPFREIARALEVAESEAKVLLVPPE